MSAIAPPDLRLLDARAARRRFDRAGASFDRHALVQAEVRGELLERLALTRLSPGVVLDAGCATAHAARALRRRYPRSLVIAQDFAPGMLRAAGAQRSWLRSFERLCADAQHLPLRDASVDLVFSNLLVPWCDPSALFAEWRRVLRDGGLLSFSCLGPDTLRELRAAWAQVDATAHVQMFWDMHDVGDALLQTGFAAPVLDVGRYTLQYRTVHALVADLRGSGNGNALRARARGLTGRGKYARLEAAYEPWRTEGRLPATVEVVFAHAWVASRAAAGAGERGVPGISLAALRSQLPRRRGGAAGLDEAGDGA